MNNNILITEKAIANFKPTYLYIKRHKITGLLYFGKTCKTDPLKYKGSGKYWSNHIKRYGINEIETLWYAAFNDIYDLVEFAIFFSEFFDIVDSLKWANKKIEDGLTGGSNGKYTEESKEKMRAAWKNRKPINEETKSKMRVAKLGKPSGAKGKTRSEEAKRQALETRMANGGCKHSDETKSKMRKPKAEGHGEKISIALKGKPKSPEHRENLSIAAKIAHANKSSLSDL